ncbi:MAG: hypothetical protein HRT61_12040 [Ekhidna sp.]|nr:hypothetical protein [Ekhidna sp.]
MNEIEKVLLSVSKDTGVSVKDIKGKIKKNPFVHARCMAIRRLWNMGYPKSDIGRAVNKSHSTVIYHLENDPPIISRRQHELVEEIIMPDPIDKQGAKDLFNMYVRSFNRCLNFDEDRPFDKGMCRRHNDMFIYMVSKVLMKYDVKTVIEVTGLSETTVYRYYKLFMQGIKDDNTCQKLDKMLG